jgi:hypothetical protein
MLASKVYSSINARHAEANARAPVNRTTIRYIGYCGVVSLVNSADVALNYPAADAPALVAFARRSISSNDTSSLCVDTCQM